MLVKRGEIYWADMGKYEGSEQGGRRPVLVIQNDKGNECSPTVICAAISSKKKHYLPVHVLIDAEAHGLLIDSVVLLEQIRTMNKQRLSYKIGCLSDEEMKKVDKALKISLGVQ